MMRNALINEHASGNSSATTKTFPFFTSGREAEKEAMLEDQFKHYLYHNYNKKKGIVMTTPPSQRYITLKEVIALYGKGQRDFQHLRISGPPPDDGPVRLPDLHLEDVTLHELNLRDAHLENLRGERIKIEFCQLQRAFLTDADLPNVDVQLSNLEGVQLQGSEMHSAQLPNIRLRGANLKSAMLSKANLETADLDGADLRGTNLRYADIRGASLQHVRISETDIEGLVQDPKTKWTPILDPTDVPRRSRGTSSSHRVGTVSPPHSQQPAFIVNGKTTQYHSQEEAILAVHAYLNETIEKKGRPGQEKFRSAISQGYSSRCAITGYPRSFLLDAAHIVPHCLTQENTLSNGILLRKDLHCLFDTNLLRIDPVTLEVTIDEMEQAPEYRRLHGTVIRPPSQLSSYSRSLWREALQWRYDEYHLYVDGWTF